MDKDRVAGSAKDVGGKVESTAGNIAGDARIQAEGFAHQQAGTAQDLYGQTKDAARDAADTATHYAKRAYENSGDAARGSSEVLVERIKANPLGSVLAAGVIGFALAVLWMRPPSRSSRGW